MKRAFVVTLLFASVPFVAAAIAQSGAENPAIRSELESLLHVPAANYRQEWVLLGSFSVRADDPEKGAKELHVVYAEPKNVEVYRETGTFPDGTVLVKDVFATKTEALTTGIASYADTLKGRFVMVKDKTGKHAGQSPLWGDGWGWTFYEGTETQKTVTTDYRKDCPWMSRAGAQSGSDLRPGLPGSETLGEIWSSRAFPARRWRAVVIGQRHGFSDD